MRRIFVGLLVLLGTLCQDISEELKERIKEAYCDAQCLKEVDSSSCERFKQCKCSTDTVLPEPTLTETNWTFEFLSLAGPEFLCKDENVLGFQWEIDQPLIYLAEIRDAESQWKFVGKTACSRIRISKLSSNTPYQMRLWGVSPKGQIYGPKSSPWVTTFHKDYEVPPVDNFTYIDLIPVGDTFTISLEWTPSEDSTCYYGLVYFVNDDGFHSYQNYDVTNIKDLFHINIPNLYSGKEYFMSIESRSANMRSRNEKSWLNFTTPSCWDTYGDLTRCIPLPIEDFQAEEIVYEQSFDLLLNWTLPILIPDYYIINVTLRNMAMFSQNVTGNETSATFYGLPLLGSYTVIAAAWSKAGSSEPAWIYKELNITTIISVVSSASLSYTTQISIIFGSVGGVLVLVMIILALVYRRFRQKNAKRESDNMNSKYYGGDFTEKRPPSLNLSTEYYIPEVVEDEWQLSPEQVVLDVLLGEGAFGVVHKGILKRDDGKEVEVAIKMLKGNPSTEEIRQFEHEIEIMKSVGTHPHLVSLLGCCSKLGYLGPFLVVEYCAKGDLQTYLRAVWEQLSGQTPETRYINDQTLPTSNFSNKVYELFDDTLLEPRDLLSFARQIAMGMEYLSSLRVVHRDLAARNVLMCSNRTVKVADFGLSRDVYQDNIYTKIGNGKLPVKWMALESLTHQQYTTQSDVWSFGIVLWEIVTLGGNPYSTISTRDLLGFLKSGYRMQCPRNCSQKLYHLMRICWRENPKERPTFGDLRKMLEVLLENENRYISLDVRF